MEVSARLRFQLRIFVKSLVIQLFLLGITTCWLDWDEPFYGHQNFTVLSGGMGGGENKVNKDFLT